ncbi:glycosyltransferase [Streptomyces sp. SID3343]|uniref:glycosyltransferase n=1 Tax=Streptomyces sp. SID3343 TaxID=2690260 RepID=UPI001369555A|nr:glycosyltransferase [Streptomyces sp. SID3343]
MIGATVVVIAYDDPDHLPTAVASALAQGDVVGEVVVVDDASTDETPRVADALAADPRVRVVHRTVNSGGCGTPRNDGILAARGEWVLFLDSDDVLPEGAVTALARAARADDADVVAGLAVRRELPEGRDVPWQPRLFAERSTHEGIAERPETLWDTLCVNKLYRRAFLDLHDIRFPDGAAHYEDFSFTARVYAAEPRLSVIPDTVYLWHVRRGATNPSISLRRDGIRNWLDRVEAHRCVVDILRTAGHEELAEAAQAKFLGHDLALYLRELPVRSDDYREQWWTAARTYLAGFAPGAFRRAPMPARWAGALLSAAEHPVDVVRLAHLSAAPARLLPPYAADADGQPVWSADRPLNRLDGLTGAAAADLPLCVEGTPRFTRRLGARVDLDVHVVEQYGLLARHRPIALSVEARHRLGDEVRQLGSARMRPVGDGWRAHLEFDLGALAHGTAMNTWDLWATVRCGDTEAITTRLRAVGGPGRRVRSSRHGVLLVQPYTTANGSLALRVADGVAGARRVLNGRLGRH